MLQPTSKEQYLLELANRFRLNPTAEYDLLLEDPFNADILEALGFFGVDRDVLAAQFAQLQAAQPLAWSEQLYAAATGHSQQMISADEQSHRVAGEAALATRVSSAGDLVYEDVSENIFAFSESPLYAHAAFAIDWGDDESDRDPETYGTGIQTPALHRLNLLNNSFREAGFSIIEERNPATDVGPEVVTQNFGDRTLNGEAWLLGVAFRDLDDDDFYSVGEGLGGVTVNISNGGFSFSTQTNDAGGYQALVPVNATSGYRVDFVRDGQTTGFDVSVTGENVKQDLRVEVGANPNNGRGKIAGIYFDDVNENGIQDSGENGLAGRRVFLDTNGNKQRDSGETRRTTDSEGVYFFNNLVPDTYAVLPEVPADRVQTLPGVVGAETYQIDDKTADSFAAFTSDTLVFNQFEAIASQGTLTSITVGLLDGVKPNELFIYQDTNNNNTPDSGDQKLVEVSPTIALNNGLTNVAIAPTTVSGTFFVGASYSQRATDAYNLVPRDTGRPAGQSWRASTSDPDSFTARAYASGNWMLRANATTAILPQVVAVSANRTVGGVNFGDAGDAVVGKGNTIAATFDVTNDHVLLGEASIALTIENQSGPAIGSYEMRLVYSDDEVIGNSDDQVVDRRTLTDLVTGEPISQRFTVQLPKDVLNSRAQREDAANQGSGYISQNVDYVALVDAEDTVLAIDDVTYFPWDINGNGTVTPTDAIFVVNRLGQGQGQPLSDPIADFDGGGVITPTDAIAAINRLGYRINSSVFE